MLLCWQWFLSCSFSILYCLCLIMFSKFTVLVRWLTTMCRYWTIIFDVWAILFCYSTTLYGNKSNLFLVMNAFVGLIYIVQYWFEFHSFMSNSDIIFYAGTFVLFNFRIDLLRFISFLLTCSTDLLSGHYVLFKCPSARLSYHFVLLSHWHVELSVCLIICQTYEVS
jgi:hypothetical protein